MAMQASDIDIYPVVPLKGGEPILENPNFTILRHASADYRSIHMRVDKPPFTDKRVRQAVAYCIDREALVKSLFNGGADIANDHSFAPVYVDTQLANSEVPQRRQDYAKAKELLAAAGMPSVDVTSHHRPEPGDAAVRRRLRGSTAGRPASTSTFDRHAGSIQTTPAGTISRGSSCRSARPIWAARGTIAQRSSRNSPTGALWNSAHWSNPQFDKLFADDNAELDHQKRQALAAKPRGRSSTTSAGRSSAATWIGAQRAVAEVGARLPSGARAT